MKAKDILAQRFVRQQIAETCFKKPDETVSWLGAMQAQDFAMAKWAIGLRLPGYHDADIEKAFNDGFILRTHVLRPTWHFVCPADIKWMLALTAPRVHAINAPYYRKEGLDSKVLKRCNDVMAKAMQGGKQLTRSEIKQVLEKAKIKTDGLRFTLLLMHAELDAVICSGARKAKQFTYALLDERAPLTKVYTKEEALAELAKRYFISRGPATLQDYAWWSGLAMKDAKESVGMLGRIFLKELVDGKEYFYAADEVRDMKTLQTTFLMPDFDEYVISYKDKSAIHTHKDYDTWHEEINLGRQHILIIDGIRAGTWSKSIKNKEPYIETEVFISINKSKQQTLAKAIKRYVSFIA